MGTFIAFIAINALLWFVIASEAARHARSPNDGPSGPVADHTTRGPRR